MTTTDTKALIDRLRDDAMRLDNDLCAIEARAVIAATALTEALAENERLKARPADDADGMMTPEEIRIEDLKQMAIYRGSVVSFEVSEPYYLASCDHCGWVGSSEHCGIDSFGDDSDVYCPRCSTGGADCGKVAEALAARPVAEGMGPAEFGRMAEAFDRSDPDLGTYVRMQIALSAAREGK